MNPECKYSNLERLAACPLQYRPSEFFTDHITGFLAPIYLEEARRISRITRIDVVQLWAWESSNLLHDSGVTEVLGEYPEYFRGPTLEDAPLVGASSRISEVYKSAFLRTLAWLRMAGRIDETEFIENTLMACPIEPSLWEVEPAPPPAWWPRLGGQNLTSPDKVGTVALADWSTLRNLVNIDRGASPLARPCLLAAEGAILHNGDSATQAISVRFSLVAFAYRVLGPTFPNPATVTRHLLHRAWWFTYPGDQSLGIFDTDGLTKLIPGDAKWKLDDLIFYSLVSRFKTITICTWQWFRGLHAPFGLSFYLATPRMKLSHDTSTWFYALKEKKVAVGRDWRFGIMDRDPARTFPPHGQFFEVEQSLLDRFLQAHDARVAHALMVEVKANKGTYDRPKVHRHFEFIGLGSIIT